MSLLARLVVLRIPRLLRGGPAADIGLWLLSVGRRGQVVGYTAEQSSLTLADKQARNKQRTTPFVKHKNKQTWMWWWASELPVPQRQVDPWGLLTSQPGLQIKLPSYNVYMRPYLKKKMAGNT